MSGVVPIMGSVYAAEMGGVYAAFTAIFLLLMSFQTFSLAIILYLMTRPYINKEALKTMREIKSSMWRLENQFYYMNNQAGGPPVEPVKATDEEKTEHTEPAQGNVEPGG